MPGTTRAFGSFQVDITPLEPSQEAEGLAMGRNRIEKQFQGDLEGTSEGQMLTAAAPGTQSAAYVALERVSGSLAGRRGSFVLQHTGAMTATGQKLTVSVVPGSGTGQLAGLSGTMQIVVQAGNHDYTFDYAFGPAA